MSSTKSTLSVTLLCVLIFHLGFGQRTDTEKKTTKEPRPREMEEDDLILFNVAAKGRVVELLANELARTEIIRALLVQYARECVQNVTVLEKHCLSCMMERCENRVSECNIKTPPLSDVISHDPIPIPGIQFLSQTPRDVQKHLKDFTSRARTDILDGIPESLRKESETIIHKEVDQSLKDLNDNIDTDSALQTISLHMQKAADNVHKIPELSTKVGTIIIANEGHVVNLAELLANRLKASRPFVDSIDHNTQRIAEQLPTILDHVNERVSVFKDKIAGVFNNVLGSFTQIMDQPDTDVMNGDEVQNDVGFQANLVPNMQMSGSIPLGPSVQQFPVPAHQRQRFINMNMQQQFMQSQFPSQLPSQPFPSPLPQFLPPPRAQMTHLSILKSLLPLQTQQFNRGRFSNQLMTNANQVLQSMPPQGPPPLGPPPPGLRPSPQNNPQFTPGQQQTPQNFQQFNQGVPNKSLQNNNQAKNVGAQSVPQQPQPQQQNQQQFSTDNVNQIQRNNPQPQVVVQPGPAVQQQSQGQSQVQSPNPQFNRVRLPSNGVVGKNRDQNSIAPEQFRSDITNQIPQNRPRMPPQAPPVRPVNRQPQPSRPVSQQASPSAVQGQGQGQPISNSIPTNGPIPVQSSMKTSPGQGQNVNQGPMNPPNILRNQVKSVRRINNRGPQNQQFQSSPNVMASGRRKRHSEADCHKLEASPELYCKQYESQCHNCTLEKRLRFEVCGEGVEKARDEIKRLDDSVEGYLKTYEKYILGQRLVLKVEMDDGKRLHKTNSYYDAYITAKIGDSILRYKTKMILNSEDTRSAGSQIGDEIWEKLWERHIFKEAKRHEIEHPEFSILGQTQNRKIPAVQYAQGSGDSGGTWSSVSYVCLVVGTAVSLFVNFL